MPRLLMVSRTPSLAMGLAGTPFDVVVLSPDEAARAGQSQEADAVLVDVQSPERAIVVLEQLRDPLAPIPALLLAAPDWDCSAFDGLPSAHVVVRPVSQSSLVAVLTDILAPAPLSPAVAAPTPPIEEPEPEPTPAPEPEPEPEPQPGPERVQTAAPVPLAPSAAKPPVAVRPQTQPDPRRGELRPIELVRLLLHHADQLPAVAETSNAVLAHALAQVAGEAGVLLLRDDDRWVVTAGSGLRPLELRCELSAEHWLVETVCLGLRGVLVKDTDIARSHLAGAPLASWRNLAAVPVRAADGVLLLARRDDPAFNEKDLTRLTKVSEEASSVLAEAIAVRDLARAMAHYRESEEGQR